MSEENMMDKLILKRFCGEEYYPLESASWSIWKDHLLVEMNFTAGENLHEDTEYLEQEPSWELCFTLENEKLLVPGLVLENKDNEENETNFYYCEHNLTYDNRLEILDREDDRLLLKITGICCDVNYYDGSKGNDSLEITLWIDQES